MPNSTRKLYLHGAHRTVGVPATSAAFEAWNGEARAEIQSQPRSLQAILICGRRNCETDALRDAVRGWLHRSAEVQVTVLDERPADRDEGQLPARVDVIVLVGDTSTLDDEVLDAVGQLTRDGCGLLALAAVPDRRRAGRRMQWSVLGAQLVGSAEARSFAVDAEPAARRHPINGHLDVAGWQTELSTAVMPLSADALVFLSALDHDERKPVAWARQPGRGRVFATLLGAEQDLTQPAFERLVTSAVAWVSQREPTDERPE